MSEYSTTCMLHCFIDTGGYLLYNVGKASTPEEGAKLIGKSLDDGSALAKFCELLKAQGVNDENADKLCSKDSNVFSVLPQAKFKTEIPALATGEIQILVISTKYDVFVQ